MGVRIWAERAVASSTRDRNDKFRTLKPEHFRIKHSTLADMIPRGVDIPDAAALGMAPDTPIVISGRGPSSLQAMTYRGAALPSYSVNVQWPEQYLKVKREKCARIRPAFQRFFPPNTVWAGGVDDHYWYGVWPLLPRSLRRGTHWIITRRVRETPWPYLEYTPEFIAATQAEFDEYNVKVVDMPPRPVDDVLPVGTTKRTQNWYGRHRQWGETDVCCARSPHLYRLGSSSVFSAMVALGLTSGPLILAGMELSNPRYAKQKVWFDNLAMVMRESRRELFLSPHLEGPLRGLAPLWQG